SMTLFALGQSIPHLFMARSLARVLLSATLPTAMAVLADTTTEGERATGMGLLGPAFGLSAILGPFVGGVLGDVSLRLPLFATGLLSVATMGLVWRLLPESLPPEKRGGVRENVSRLKAFQPDTTWLYVIAFLAAFSRAGLETAFPFL